MVQKKKKKQQKNQPTHQFCTIHNDITADYHGLLHINRESKKWMLQFKSEDYLHVAELIEQYSRVDSPQSYNIKDMVMQVLLRDRPFNLQGWGEYGFFFRLGFFFGQHKS